jgi:hypothetical protein
LERGNFLWGDFPWVEFSMGREDFGDELTRRNFTQEDLSELLLEMCPTFSLPIQFFI